MLHMAISYKFNVNFAPLGRWSKIYDQKDGDCAHGIACVT